MKIMIQCAARKSPHARHLTDSNGARIMFVAKPEIAPPAQGLRYARPDHIAADGKSWVEYLREYNEQYNKHGNNPCQLTPAYQLYADSSYKMLVNRYGTDNVFVLSAGWGLVNAKFLLPKYDITFSTEARGMNAYKRRYKHDDYGDLCMLRLEDNDALVFFGSKNYQSLFCKLTENYQGKRFAFYKSKYKPNMPGCELIKCENPARYWYYPCDRDFANGKISLPASP